MTTLPLYRAGVPDLPGHDAPVSAYAFTARHRPPMGLVVLLTRPS